MATRPGRRWNKRLERGPQRPPCTRRRRGRTIRRKRAHFDHHFKWDGAEPGGPAPEPHYLAKLTRHIDHSLHASSRSHHAKPSHARHPLQLVTHYKDHSQSTAVPAVPAHRDSIGVAVPNPYFGTTNASCCPEPAVGDACLALPLRRVCFETCSPVHLVSPLGRRHASSIADRMRLLPVLTQSLGLRGEAQLQPDTLHGHFPHPLWLRLW